MNDPIERQAVIDVIFSEPLYETGMKKRSAEEVVPAIFEKVKGLPPAEPEIIYCKDCIYHPIVPENWNGSKYSLEWPVGEDGLDNCPCHCPDDYYSWVPDEDWFCGNGKKRREQNEL